MSDTGWPISVKGVVLHAGSVLLAYNERAEWELPGGRLEERETLEACVEREILEETGLTVQAGRLLDSMSYQVLPGKSVVIVAYQCQPTDPGQAPIASQEHAKVAYVPLGELDTIKLPDPYRTVIQTAASRPSAPSRPVLRLPLIDKDVLREATLLSTPGAELSHAPWGPGLWYAALESLLDLGVSLVGDMTLFPGVSETDVKSRLAAGAGLICVHCRCSAPAQRWQAKLDGDPLRRDQIPELLPTVLGLEKTLVEPLDLGCPTVIVDTTDGYQPPLSIVDDQLRALLYARPVDQSQEEGHP